MHSFDFLFSSLFCNGYLRSSSRPTVTGLTSPSRQHNLMFTRFPFPHYYIPFSYLAIDFRNFPIFIIEIKKGTQCLLFLLFFLCSLLLVSSFFSCQCTHAKTFPGGIPIKIGESHSTQKFFHLLCIFLFAF